MSASPAPSVSSPTALRDRVPAGRDLSVDLVRALCLPFVVVLHALQMGIGGEPLRAGNALADNNVLAWGTWAFMIMPTFFFAGGFGNTLSWQRMRARGEGWGDFVRARALRLLLPTAIAIAAVGACTAALLLGGMDHELLRTVGIRLAEPLWFIPIYAACTFCIPLMTTLYERAPIVTLLTLAGATTLIDAGTRLGATWLAPFNWLTVWLFAQQLGATLADGRAARMGLIRRVLLVAGSYGAMAALWRFGGYSNDMLDDLNPPNLMILGLTLAQWGMFTILQPLFRRLMSMPWMLATIAVLGMRGMRLYLWHTFAMLVLIAGQLALGIPFPTPGTHEWWATRGLWLAALVGALVLICLVPTRGVDLGRSARHGRMHPLEAVIAGMLGATGVAIVLVGGYVPLTNAGIGLALLAISLIWLLTGGLAFTPKATLEPARGEKQRSAAEPNHGEKPARSTL